MIYWQVATGWRDGVKHFARVVLLSNLYAIDEPAQKLAANLNSTHYAGVTCTVVHQCDDGCRSRRCRGRDQADGADDCRRRPSEGLGQAECKCALHIRAGVVVYNRGCSMLYAQGSGIAASPRHMCGTAHL